MTIVRTCRCGNPVILCTAGSCNVDKDTIEQLQHQLSEAEAAKGELVECLRDIVREKELHGYIVDGTIVARKMIAKHSTTDSKG